jgi:hypothetical protein
MTQIDPRRPTTTPNPNPGEPRRKQEPSFNWRVSVGMAVGLLVLFGVLFGLRALDIFPPKPAEDPQIAAVRATLAALPTQQAAPAVQPTPASTQAPAPATLGPIALSTPAATGAAPAAATVASAPTTAPTPAAAPQSGTQTQTALATGTQFDTAPTPVATTASDQVNPAAGSAAAASSSGGPTPAPTSGQPTPVAVNLPSGLANAILQGYTNYWNIRLQAVESPADQSIDLESVMAGNELDGARKTLAEMRDNNEAGYSTVNHTIWIVHATNQDAVIVDRYVARTIKLDPESKAPLASEPTIEQYSDTFQLQNVDGAWKVIREDAGEVQ